jgi:hypothetical protein
MSYAEDSQRERLIDQVLGARKLQEIVEATEALKQWVKTHPDDLGIIDGFEQLSLMEDIARERECAEATTIAEAEQKIPTPVGSR